MTAIAEQALADAHRAAIAVTVPVWLRRVDENVEASPEGHLQVFVSEALNAAAPILQAAALRAYAQRWHSTTEGIAQPADYGTGVEYDEICQCGVSVDEDGCPEVQQLLADAAAIEAGQPFREQATTEAAEGAMQIVDEQRSQLVAAITADLTATEPDLTVTPSDNGHHVAFTIPEPGRYISVDRAIELVRAHAADPTPTQE